MRVPFFIFIVKTFFLLLLLLFCYQYFQVKCYTFPEPSPFQGDFWYNPYANAEDIQWFKANFHAPLKRDSLDAGLVVFLSKGSCLNLTM